MKKQLRNSEIRDIKNKLSRDYRLGEAIDMNARVELVDNQILLVDNEPLFFSYNGRWIPTCRFLQRNQVLKKIVIDKGAIRFIAGGADLFRPGIVQIDEEIEKGEVIAIAEESHDQVIAVGEALQPGSEMKLLKEGKMVKNIHWVGDRIWNI